jgi:tetratricopeptide (TPR) repeat protein
MFFGKKNPKKDNSPKCKVNTLARGSIKILLKDYQKALEDFDKANVFKPNNTFTLTIHGNVKITLEDYHRTLEDIDKAYVIEPNTSFVLIVPAHINGV